MDNLCVDCGGPLKCRPEGASLHDFDCPVCSPELFNDATPDVAACRGIDIDNLPELSPQEKQLLDETDLVWETGFQDTGDFPTEVWRLQMQRPVGENRLTKHTVYFPSQEAALGEVNKLEAKGATLIHLRQYTGVSPATDPIVRDPRTKKLVPRSSVQ